MYRVNPLPRKVLITTDEVIALAPTDDNVDPRMLLSSITIAEDRFIKPAICKSLYYDFRNRKNVLVDAINKDMLEDLVNEDNTGEVILLTVGQMINAVELIDLPAYVELWNEHLWKLLAECVIYIATPVNYTRFTSQGEMQNNPRSITGEGQGSASAESRDVKWKMDKLLQDRIDPIIASMHEWLCDNKATFPLYDCKDCYCKDNNGISYQRKSAWVHGLYSKNKKECCDE